jgi:CubicO group peptidase (beta-lactamase class C family)
MVLKVAVSPDSIQGDVDEGYGKVADAFRKNFAEGREIGAAVAVYRDGKKVVDMWGGYRNGRTKQPWQHDTMVMMFSTTKGISAMTVAVAVSKGLFSYDDRVADIWPDFAQAGKADVTVRQLLGHQAGLCALTPAPTLADVADPERLSPILAAQKPAWTPGTRHGYHAITVGW